MFAVGSGGSFSASYFAALLYQSQGTIAKAITPLEVYYSKEVIKDTNLLFISASGKNSDILFGFKTAMMHEPNSIISICMINDTPITKLSNKYSISKSFEFNIPTGKDGFLATNCLIAFFTILYKAFNSDKVKEELKEVDKNFINDLNTFSSNVTPHHTFIVMYGGWGQPVAIDIESKFTEAALGNVLLSDYRNFGHGRHHWLAKRSKESAIIALITPREEKIAEKTLLLIPEEIPKLIIKSEYDSPFSSIDLLAKAFFLAEKIGAIQNIDPGKPGVPDFGREIYHLKYASFYKLKKSPSVSFQTQLAILRKTKNRSISKMSNEEFNLWLKKYKCFINQFRKGQFGSIVLDYDGTLCSSENRTKGPSDKVMHELIRILKAGFVIGIATGRGQSVRKDLQKSIPKAYWKNVVIGYYNGSDIGILADSSRPDKTSKTHNSLIKIKNILIKNTFSIFSFNVDLRPYQLTIEVSDKRNWDKAKAFIQNIVMQFESSNIQLLESSHSIDIIIKPEATKHNVISECKKKAISLGIPIDCICIGDKGQWPGNDFELLSTPCSLSVDEVSFDPDSCWNISSAGIRNTDACIEYLKKIRVLKKHLIFDIK
ncbi:hypothetical protein ES705_13564 [subsurface metagenome]